jgi:hypothetical protein
MTEPIFNNLLLDSVHELFPEFLYDTTIFPNSDLSTPVGWFRYRVMHFYPQSFRRGRQIYETSELQNTRNDYDDWMFLQNRRVPVQTTPIRFPSLTRVIYANDFTTPINRNTFVNANIPLTPPVIRRTASRDDRTNGLGLLSAAISANLDEWLASFMDPVPVPPTTAQIEAGSEILQAEAVTNGTMCTICQDNTSSSPRDLPWRRLRGCSHLFHKHCIDRWYTRNAHCPVCRADIREQAVPGPSVAPSQVETPDSPM